MVTTEAPSTDGMLDLLNALEIALDAEVSVTMRTGKPSVEEAAAIRKIDAAIKASPGLSKPLTLNRGYEGMPEIRDGGELTEQAFFVGSTKPLKPGDHTPVAMAVAAGTPALRLNDETYILDRGLTILVYPTKTGPVPATMVDGPAVPGIRLTTESGTGGWETVMVEEFFNPLHAKDGRFGAGKSGGGAAAARTPEQQARRDKVIKIVAGVAAAVVVVGAVGLILSGGKPPEPKGDEPPGHAGDEKTKSLEKAVLDKHRPEVDKWADDHKARSSALKDLGVKAQARTPNGVETAARDRIRDRTPEERESVQEYTKVANERVNRVLRGKDASTPEVDEHIRKIDAAFEHSAVDSHGITLYRGIGRDLRVNNEGKFETKQVVYKVGEIIQDDAYVSTSISKAIASGGNFGGSGGTLLTIKTKPDTKVIAGDRSETELIINRSPLMKVTKVEHCPDGICRIDAEVI